LPEILFILFVGYGLSGYVIWVWDIIKKRSGKAPPPATGA